MKETTFRKIICEEVRLIVREEVESIFDRKFDEKFDERFGHHIGLFREDMFDQFKIIQESRDMNFENHERRITKLEKRMGI